MRYNSSFVLMLFLLSCLLAASSAQCAIYYVKTDGLDTNSGASWALAKKTITAAINAASDGDEIWVAVGDYRESVTIKSSIALYGGFSGTETEWDQRRISRYKTTIDPNFTGTAIKVATQMNEAVVDGFVIQRGLGESGGGIYCYNSYVTISNNVITANRNTTGNGGGVSCFGGTARVFNNLIFGNIAARGAGISLNSTGGNTVVANNTIADNTASVEGGGIYANYCIAGLTISNNIVAFNVASGIAGYNSPAALRKNNVFGNSGGHYSGQIVGGADDIKSDPLFVLHEGSTRDYHLKRSPASPCVNAGLNSVRPMSSTDIDGQRRVNEGIVDIGSDESFPPPAVNITVPTSGTLFRTVESTISIGGTASDGVVGLTWQNSRGGSGVCQGTTAWTAANIALTPGNNIIEVTADDGATTAKAVITIAYDAAPPTVAIVQPTDAPTYSTTSPLLSIAGTATDDIGLKAVTWSSDRGSGGTCTGVESWTAAGIALLPGDNVITVTAVDVVDRTAIDQIRVTFTDTVAPTVQISSPTNAETYITKNTTIQLGGTASDDVALSLVRWTNDRGGSGTCDGTTNWSANIPLQEGANVLTITAVDTSTNASTDLITVTCDSTKPQVTITGPSSTGSYETNSPRVDIAGTASDSQGVTGVSWAVSGGGSGTCTGKTSWEAYGLLLKPGQNTITVTANDAAGNAGTASIIVTFTDVTPPTCTITGPTSSASYATNSVRITISGKSSDDDSVSSVAWSNSRGGSGTCTGTTSWSVSNVLLQPGLNSITVTATDSSGNHTSDALDVTFTDTTAPTISITFPTSDSAFMRNSATAKLSGTASDDVGVASVYWWSDRGGTGVCSGTETWTANDIALQPGANVITVVAGDATSGLTGTAVVTITRISDLPADAWEGIAMVSLPLVPDETDPALTVDFAGSGWYSYQTPNKSYASYPEHFTWFEPPASAPGRGFWARFGATVTPPIGSAVGQDKPKEIGLFSGWNLIGQPFLQAVEWDLDAIAVREPGGESQPLAQSNAVGHYAWGWDNVQNQYYLVYDPELTPGSAGTLAPWRAYWIRAYRDCTLILPAP